MPALDPIINVSWESATVRGRPETLPTDLRERLLSVKFVDKVSGASKLDVQLDNADLSLFDEPRLAEGNKLHVQWGYANDLTPTHVVTIKSVKGWRTLTIEGESTEELAAVALQRTRLWENATEFEVAEELARELGYTAENQRDIRPPEGWEEERRDIQQAGETDMAFLTRLAGRLDLHWYIQGGRFHFHPPNDDQPPAHVLRYWDDPEGVFAGEPSITEGTLGLPGRVTRRSHSPRQRRRVTGSAGNDTDTDRPVMGEDAPLRDPGEPAALTEAERSAAADDDYFFRWAQGRENQTVMDPVQDQVEAGTDGTDGQARNRARSGFRRAERKAIKLTLPLIGLTWLKADMTIRLEFGVEKLDGNYLVEEVAHTVGNGYVCRATVKRNASSRSSAGAARNRASTAQAEARIRANIERLNELFTSGRINRETYDRRWSRWNERLEELRSARRGAGARDSSGRPNTGDVRPDGELEARSGTDADTGGRRVDYNRRGADDDFSLDFLADEPRCESVFEGS